MSKAAPLIPHLESHVLARQGVRHAFFTREGGVSTGVYQSLNCGPGSGDDPRAVAENRRRVAGQMGTPETPLLTPYQIHSHHAVTVSRPFAESDRPHADALVTNQPGLILGILTADCAPVLFADAEAGVIGAAHAGWKGALTGVIESTVAAMEKIGARRARIAAAIGPAIAQPSYEVSDEFRDHFLADGSANERFFGRGARAGHWQFDLEGFVVHRIAQAGVRMIDPLGRDTYSDEALFFSYRRATHRRETDYGRQIATIVLTGNDHD
ncbi:MAG: peptidoglycan editing factor PgeF [Alphaproteobacteria bacterium]|nr:MAG: peptidoglycan editing factor PgeF [Alphaproteobacteria bacterium]